VEFVFIVSVHISLSVL